MLLRAVIVALPEKRAFSLSIISDTTARYFPSCVLLSARISRRVTMAKSSETSSRDVNEFLREVLDDVNHWLHYAEAKNGTILVLSSGIIVVLLDGMFNLPPPPNQTFALWATLVGLISMGFSAFFSAFSFSPRLLDISKSAQKSPSKNILFFMAAADLSASEYLAAVAERIGEIPEKDKKLAAEFADQICINSRITSAKMNAFKWSLRAFLASLVISGAILIVALIPILKSLVE